MRAGIRFYNVSRYSVRKNLAQRNQHQPGDVQRPVPGAFDNIYKIGRRYFPRWQVADAA